MQRAVKRLKALRAAALPLASPKEESQASSNTFDFDVRPLRFDIFQELQKLCDEDETDDDDQDDQVFKLIWLRLQCDSTVVFFYLESPL